MASGLFDVFDPLKDVAQLRAYTDYLSDISGIGTQLNKVFTQNRQRIVEMEQSVADAIPVINRLGGDIDDTVQTISDIAVESNRNVIANTESVEKLYAASKILDTTAGEITKKFGEVGVTFDKIGTKLEDSIAYVQSVGGNAAQVMSTVLANTDQLNRFQFEKGIVGMTKMAAQSSMMRFNMQETFNLAEKVLSPEGAVEVASAFQRLGVQVGNLVDPFQLMNQSINDPSGLQDSLINVGKQFTYFDEQAQQFKINPQGVLILKQIEEQTGVSARELSKAGLAAAELDARLSSISPQIKFTNEEDKKYLANIASMEGGQYVVKIDGGEVKKLSDITQSEMDKLIDEQKKQPKTLEDIQRNQLSLTELLSGDVKAIRNAIIGGVVTTRQGLGFVEGTRTAANITGGAVSDFVGTKGVREVLEGSIDNIVGAIKSIYKGDNLGETMTELSNSFSDLFEKTSNKFGENADKLWNDMVKNIQENFGYDINEILGYVESSDSEKRSIQKEFMESSKGVNDNVNSLIDEIEKNANRMKEMQDQFEAGFITKDQLDEMTRQYNSSIEKLSNTMVDGLGVSSETIRETTIKDIGRQIIEGNKQIIDPIKLDREDIMNKPLTEVMVHKHEFSKIMVELKLPENFAQLNTEQQQIILDKIFNSPQFQQYIINLNADNQNNLKQPGVNRPVFR